MPACPVCRYRLNRLEVRALLGPDGPIGPRGEHVVMVGPDAAGNGNEAAGPAVARPPAAASGPGPAHREAAGEVAPEPVAPVNPKP